MIRRTCFPTSRWTMPWAIAVSEPSRAVTLFITVDQGNTLFMDGFDVSVIPNGSTITGAVLHVEWGVQGGYGGGRSVEWAFDAGGMNPTAIIPSDLGVWSGDQTVDLFVSGVDTKAEIGSLDVQFFNDDPGGAADAVNFDYIIIEVTYVPPACSRNAPTITLGGDQSVTPSGSTGYTVSITNNDVGAGCPDSDFALTITNETQTPPGSFLASGLSAPSVTVAVGATDTSVTLTVTGSGAGSDGDFVDSTVEVRDDPDHAGQQQTDVATTTISVVGGDGHVLKRSVEETCHGCHKTDGNRVPADPDWGEAIKTHNSTNTGSTKWAGSGGWGITGGRYGEFGCTTCHTAHDTYNIYLIKEQITAADGLDVPVDFQAKSGNPGDPGLMGEDSTDTPRPGGSVRVCEACHTYDGAGTNGVNAHPNVVGVALPNHQGGDTTDCTTCHSHRTGFTPGGCDGCHGGSANFGPPERRQPGRQYGPCRQPGGHGVEHGRRP